MPLLRKRARNQRNQNSINGAFPGGSLGKMVTRDFRAGFKSFSLIDSFGYAWEGIMYAFRTQRNFRIHSAMTALAFTAAYVLHLDLMEWAILWGITGMVLFAELANTAIELVVDMITEGRYDLRAKAIKDTAAGAVFVVAMSAVAIGLCIFIPHLAQVLA